MLKDLLMNKQELLDQVNGLIEDEGGFTISSDLPISSSGIDSFGMTMVLLEISNTYRLWDEKEFSNIDFVGITVDDIYEMIMSKK